MAVLTGWDMVLLESALLVIVVIIVAILLPMEVRCSLEQATRSPFCWYIPNPTVGERDYDA